MFPRHPDVCQSCGATTLEERNRWQECDEEDLPEPIVVVLCTSCSDRLIEKHPRLYHQLERNQPWPGAMPLFVECGFRCALRCSHPDLKANGGPGLRLKAPPKLTGFWDGRGGPKGGKRVGGMFTHYTGPVASCAGRTLAEGAAS